MEKQTPKKIIRTKKWEIVVNIYDDDTSDLMRTNDGFSPLELIGLSELSIFEIRNQMLGIIKPDVVTRKVIIDEPMEPQK